MFKLLIVDDEESIRNGIAKMLPWEEYGIACVETAENGEDAAKKVGQLHPDILIVDMHMPIMNGIEFIQWYNSQHELGKIIVLSGYNDFALVRKAMKLGAADYLLKPASCKEMESAVEEAIGSLSSALLSYYDNKEHLELLKTNVMNRWIYGTISGRELREKLEVLGIIYEEQQFLIGIMEAEPEEEKEDFSDVQYEIYQTIQKKCRQEPEYIAFTDAYGRLILVFTAEEFSETHTVQAERLQAFQNELERVLPVHLHIALSITSVSWRKLSVLYFETLQLLQKEKDTKKAQIPEYSYSLLVRNSLAEVEKSYANCDMSLAWLAEKYQVNTAYLGRIFRKECGTSFTDYLNEYRVQKAKELLQNIALKGQDVAEQTGFVNYNYFYITFKKITGKTPTEFRRTL